MVDFCPPPLSHLLDRYLNKKYFKKYHTGSQDSNLTGSGQKKLRKNRLDSKRDSFTEKMAHFGINRTTFKF